MRRIKIGILVDTEPARLQATLAGLRAHTPFAYELLLLPDGPDVPTQTMLATLRDIPQSAAATPCGAAACFNRLVRAADADVFIFLESGAIVGPGWLDHLLAALAADPRNGLAGPTTNIAWNEQGVYPHSGSTPADIAHTAHDAHACFGATVRTLEPLYSLVDFCYVVRREVIEVVGAADERYGLGPCWEMDYSIRAARAGFHGVWACAAYVHRLPFTARRRGEEDRRFELSKRLYQHKFCAGHLRGDKTDYRPHCRGDECSNFAQAASIEIHRPFPEMAVGDPLITSSCKDNQPSSVLPLLSNPAPLVSCIMPTWNRRKFILHALDYFFRQDYPNVELIIVDDGDDPISDCLPADKRLRYIRLDRRLSLGAKRNLACQQARGVFIVHWDDDDWYPSWRVTAQVRALHEQRADVCGTSEVYYYELGRDRAWQYVYRRRGGTPGWLEIPWRIEKPSGNIINFLMLKWERIRNFCGEPSQRSFMISEAHGGVRHDSCGNVRRKVTMAAYWRHCASQVIHH